MDGERNIRHKTNSFNRRHHSTGDLQVNTYRFSETTDFAPEHRPRALSGGLLSIQSFVLQ